MATSGSKSVAVTGQHTLKFSWTENSQSVANNTTTVGWKLELIAGNGNINSSAAKAWSVTVNGTKYSGTNTVGIGVNTTKTLASGTTTIGHNSDGAKTFSYSFSQEFAITYSGSWVGTKSGSGTGTLDVIPRASTVSAENAYIASATTIKILRKSSSFKHTLQYKVGSGSYTTIVSKTSDTSYNWVIPTSVYELIPKAKKTTITINCITYNGDTNIGSNTCTLTATCRESLCKPYVIPDVVDTNTVTMNLTGDETKLIKYYSKAYVYSNADAQYEATVTSQKITNGSKYYTSSPCTFTGVTSGKFTFDVTDSRGFSISEVYNAPFVDYVKLTCVLKVDTPTAAGTSNLSVTGKYFNGSFGAYNNTLRIDVRLKMGDEAWTEWQELSTPTLDGNTYSIDTPLQNLDYQTTYGFQVRAVDKLATVNSAEVMVKAAPIFDWGKDDFKFNVPVGFNNGTDAIRGVNTQGTVVDVIQPCNTSDNMVIGWGNWNEGLGGTNMYGNIIRLFTKDDLVVREFTENKYYSLLGAARAMSQIYELESTITKGDNYSAASGNACICGNILRCYMNITRSSAPSVGNITNEVVAHYKIQHDGKIADMLHTCFGNAGTGSVASFYTHNMVLSDNYIEFDVSLTATTVASTGFNAFFELPIALNLTAFTE